MLFNLRTALIFSSLSVGGIAGAQSAVLERYEEPYRPQYHFSPETGWIGDPDGLIHYNGGFSLFWWGKATSTDLVHYTQESSLVMTGDAGNVRYFSGSVVVDKRNTAGFGMRDSRSANDSRYVDLGLDFYASRTFRDYDETLTRTTSVGWVSTWAYANQVPSSWGMGFWSIPRDLALKSYPEGVRLLQTPVGGLKSLRQEPVAFVASLTAGTRVLPKFRPKRNIYEVDATFDTNIPNRFGFDLCVGNGHRVAIRYDSQRQILTIDRTNSSAAPIPGFARQASAPVAPLNNRLRLRIYVDTSSVEVFANEGREVFTLLTYAGDAQTEIEIFAEHPGTITRFKGWRLKSIWHETPKRGAP